MRWIKSRRRDRALYVVTRNGKAWAGPYKWQGYTFTRSQRYWYRFASPDNAEATAHGCGLTNYEITPLESMIDAT